MPPPPTIGGGRYYVLRSSVRPSVNTYFACRRFSGILSGRISMKRATNIHHVSANCRKDFQGQRSKVMSQRDQMHLRRRHTFRRRGVETDLFWKFNLATEGQSPAHRNTSLLQPPPDRRLCTQSSIVWHSSVDLTFQQKTVFVGRRFYHCAPVGTHFTESPSLTVLSLGLILTCLITTDNNYLTGLITPSPLKWGP